MSYAIIGFGAVGQALAAMFARKGLDVSVATTREPKTFADKARSIGPQVFAKTLAEAVEADVILLAVPFQAHRQVAEARSGWEGRTLIDVTNAYGVPLAELDGRPSSAVVADAFEGAKLVKAFNHLPAAVLSRDPDVNGGKRVVFLAGDAPDATKSVAGLVEALGFAPVDLGRLEEGGALVQARGNSWAPLIFQDLVKFP